MFGMEMMLSNLIGMTPDQMKAAADNTMKLIEAASKDIIEIKETQSRIESKLDLVLKGKADKNAKGKSNTGNANNSSECVQL